MDLQFLAERTASGAASVVREGDASFYLTSPDIDKPPTSEKPYVIAGRLLGVLNGLAALDRSDFRPVELSGKQTDGGSTTIYPVAFIVEVRAAHTASASVRSADGAPVADAPSPWPRRVDLAASNRDVAEVLQVMSRADIGWSDLYDVFEIVRESITSQVHELMDVSRSVVSRFTGSAQQGRHIRPNRVPTNPMTFPEGRDFVSSLVSQWMTLLMK